MPDPDPQPTVVTDGRCRVTLPGARNQRYVYHRAPDGTITLTPAVVLTRAQVADIADLRGQLEAAFAGDAALQARFAHAREHPEDARPFVPRADRTPTMTDTEPARDPQRGVR